MTKDLQKMYKTILLCLCKHNNFSIKVINYMKSLIVNKLNF
jgi:hypothetical protein